MSQEAVSYLTAQAEGEEGKRLETQAVTCWRQLGNTYSELLGSHRQHLLGFGLGAWWGSELGRDTGE